MIGKVAVVGVSLIVVVCVVVSVVYGMGRDDHSDNDGPIASTSSSMKAISSICSPTEYKDLCITSLRSVSDNGSATPKDYIKAAIGVTIEEMKNSLDMSSTFVQATNDSTQAMALQDCKDLLQFAIDELQASYSSVGDSELHSMNDRVTDVKNWLSAVISYQETCLDGISNNQIKTAMENGLLNATQLSSNALAIVAGISKIFNTFNVTLNNTGPSSRRLLCTMEVGDDGYPTWFSATDRKLLAIHQKGHVNPNAVVTKDGSGQFKTIAAALAAYPKNHKGRYVIYIKAGIYHEYITVTKDQVNVFMYGDGPRKTMVTGRKSNCEGVSTYQTATFCEFIYLQSLLFYHSSVAKQNCFKNKIVHFGRDT